MIRFENFKLFIILFFVLSVTTLIYNFQNPLFRLKLQLLMKGYKAEPQAKNTETSEGKLLSIYKLVDAPVRSPQIVSPQPTSGYLEPTTVVLPTNIPNTPVPLRNLAVNKTEPTVAVIEPTKIVPKTQVTPGVTSVTKLAWKAIFKGVEAAENSQTGAVSVKIAAGTEYTTRSYTLKDGQTISVIVPIFKD